MYNLGEVKFFPGVGKNLSREQCKYTLSYYMFCYISESKESQDTEHKFLG